MILTPVDSWVWTANREFWEGEEYSTKEEAVKACKIEALPGFNYYVGQLNNVDFELADIDIPEYKIDSIIEGLNNRLSNYVGKGSKYWTSNITQEQIKELRDKIQAAVFDWIVNNVGQPITYSVENIEEIEVETGMEETT